MLLTFTCVCALASVVLEFVVDACVVTLVQI